MTKVVLSPDVLYQELDNEVILLEMKSGSYFGLDPVGARMWSLLAESGDSEIMFGQLLAEYDVDEPTLRGDTERLVAELVEAGLLTTAQGS